MYVRTTQPEAARQRLGGHRLPSVAVITRLMDQLDANPTLSTHLAAETSAQRGKQTGEADAIDSPSIQRDDYLTAEQRAHIGASFLGIAGLCIVSTVIAAASHAVEWSGLAAIGLFSAGVACLLAALLAFEQIGIYRFLISCALLITLCAALSLHS
jgi:hypothetical protein